MEVTSYLGDAVEAAHQRVQRVEETQEVVQVSGQPGDVVHQLNQRGRHHAHLREVSRMTQ